MKMQVFVVVVAILVAACAPVNRFAVPVTGASPTPGVVDVRLDPSPQPTAKATAVPTASPTVAPTATPAATPSESPAKVLLVKDVSVLPTTFFPLDIGGHALQAVLYADPAKDAEIGGMEVQLLRYDLPDKLDLHNFVLLANGTTPLATQSLLEGTPAINPDVANILNFDPPYKAKAGTMVKLDFTGGSIQPGGVFRLRINRIWAPEKRNPDGSLNRPELLAAPFEGPLLNVSPLRIGALEGLSTVSLGTGKTIGTIRLTGTSPSYTANVLALDVRQWGEALGHIVAGANLKMVTTESVLISGPYAMPYMGTRMWLNGGGGAVWWQQEARSFMFTADLASPSVRPGDSIWVEVNGYVIGEGDGSTKSIAISPPVRTPVLTVIE